MHNESLKTLVVDALEDLKAKDVALLDAAVSERLLQDYERDIRDSEEITLARWQRRPRWEKIVGPFVWILERQQ